MKTNQETMKRTRNTYGSTNGDNDGPTAIAAMAIIIKQWMRQYDDDTKTTMIIPFFFPIANPLQ